MGLAGTGIGIYLYFKPVKNLAKTKAHVTALTPVDLKSFFSNVKSAEDSYIGKIVELSGVVTEISILQEGGGYVLMEYDETSVLVNAQLDHRVLESPVKVGDSCVIRAEFTGLEEDLIDPDLIILYFKQTVIIKP